MYKNIFFTDIQLPNPLPDEEIRKLFIEMKSGNKEAKEKIVLHNIRLVINEVNKFNVPDKEELFLCGIEGLIFSVNNFDLSKNKKFSTYAQVCIRYAMTPFLRIQNKSYKNISLNKKSKDGNSEFGNIIQDNYDLIEDINNKELKEILVNLVNNLPDLEKEIIKLYFGFYGKEYKQKEIAEMLSFSQAYISNTISKTLNKLKIHLKVETLTKTK